MWWGKGLAQAKGPTEADDAGREEAVVELLAGREEEEEEGVGLFEAALKGGRSDSCIGFGLLDDASGRQASVSFWTKDLQAFVEVLHCTETLHTFGSCMICEALILAAFAKLPISSSNRKCT